jgi:hypothetical protein
MPKNSKTRKSVYGGAAYSYDPAPVDYFDSKTAELNLGQGRQFSDMNAARHGGSSVGLLSASYPNSLSQALPQDLMESARLLPLQKAFDEIKGLQDGGRRKKRISHRSRRSHKNRKARRNNRKASRKNRMNRRSTRKNRKASRKNRKASRKNRKSRKNRRSSRKASRKNRKGGALGFQEVNAPGMLLTPAQYAKAGLNADWELAKDPNAFAPLASRN